MRRGGNGSIEFGNLDLCGIIVAAHNVSGESIGCHSSRNPDSMRMRFSTSEFRERPCVGIFLPRCDRVSESVSRGTSSSFKLSGVEKRTLIFEEGVRSLHESEAM